MKNIMIWVAMIIVMPVVILFILGIFAWQYITWKEAKHA